MSVAIVPPNFCAIVQCLAESSSYFDAKLLLYFEIQADALKFCSTSV